MRKIETERKIVVVCVFDPLFQLGHFQSHEFDQRRCFPKVNFIYTRHELSNNCLTMTYKIESQKRWKGWEKWLSRLWQPNSI